MRSSEAAMGGGRAAPRLAWQCDQKDGCAQRTGAHARPKPTSLSIIISNETTHLIGCRVKGERIRLDHILEGKFKPNSFNATYIGEFLMPFSICILFSVYTVPFVYMVRYV
jgi:hypothetical protein